MLKLEIVPEAPEKKKTNKSNSILYLLLNKTCFSMAGGTENSTQGVNQNFPRIIEKHLHFFPRNHKKKVTVSRTYNLDY